VLQRLKQGEAADSHPTPPKTLLHTRRAARGATVSSPSTGSRFRVTDVMPGLAKCFRPVPGDPIVRLTSRSARGSRIHRVTAQRRDPMKDPDRVTPFSWDRLTPDGVPVRAPVDGWDRHSRLEDMSLTFADA